MEVKFTFKQQHTTNKIHIDMTNTPKQIHVLTVAVIS